MQQGDGKKENLPHGDDGGHFDQAVLQVRFEGAKLCFATYLSITVVKSVGGTPNHATDGPIFHMDYTPRRKTTA